jgi:hypothetical protein
MATAMHIEERTLRRGDIDLRLMINHSHRHMRFMDYRVGNYPDKREALDNLVRELGLRKVFTLVEKQDSQNWRSAGFTREGVYPSFFRTADAYTMSRLYDEAGQPLPATAPIKAQPDEQTSFPSRKLRKPEGIRVELVQDERSRGTILSGFNGELRALPFGRTGAPDVVLHAKMRKQEGWICAEINDSFGHATLGYAPAPLGEDDLALGVYAIGSMVTKLQEQGVANLFALAPVSDRWSNELFSGLGFKVSGRLADHLRTPDGYSMTLIWHLRLARAPEPNPEFEEK